MNNIDAVQELIQEKAEYSCEKGGTYQICEPTITNTEELARQIDALYPKKEEIEARERERILRYLKGLLGANPNASLAATIDVIETEGKSLEALKAKEVSNG
jgi:hypothetical protein